MSIAGSHKTLAKITDDELARFRHTGRDTDDIGECVEDESYVGVPGRVYCGDNLFIEAHGDTPDGPHPTGRRWALTILNRSYQSDDLAELEERLCEFAVEEGYLTPTGTPSPTDLLYRAGLGWAAPCVELVGRIASHPKDGEDNDDGTGPRPLAMNFSFARDTLHAVIDDARDVARLIPSHP